MKLPVRCYFEDIASVKLNIHSLNAWILHVLQEEKATLKYLNIVLCSDAFLLTLNLGYLNHDTYTDIITFPYHESGQAIEGELYISLERVKENAHTLNVPWRDEMDRVMIHGVLHLLGYDDATPEQKDAIRQREDYCLTLRA